MSEHRGRPGTARPGRASGKRNTGGETATSNSQHGRSNQSHMQKSGHKEARSNNKSRQISRRENEQNTIVEKLFMRQQSPHCLRDNGGCTEEQNYNAGPSGKQPRQSDSTLRENRKGLGSVKVSDLSSESSKMYHAQSDKSGTSNILNPSAAEFTPKVSSISLQGGSLKDANINTDHYRSEKFNESNVCLQQINLVAEDSMCSLQHTSCNSSLGCSNVTTDAWSNTFVTSKVTGRLQGACYKSNANIGVSPHLLDVSKNDCLERKMLSFEKFEKWNRSWRDKDFKIVHEIEADLFAMDKSYALGHCVAADMNMGSGIAVTFRREFKKVDELLAQRQSAGGLALLNHDGRFIYYLVTKRESSKKPTYESIYRSMEKLREHMVENGVEKLALPRLGCGLDRLEWSKVKGMLEYVFQGTAVEITICNFQKAEESMSEQKQMLCRRMCQVDHVSIPLTQIGIYTMIIYLGSVDGYVDKVMEQLDDRFRIIKDYKNCDRKLGATVTTVAENYAYYLIGCIVKKTKTDLTDLKEFSNCLANINKDNKKFSTKNEHYTQVAIASYYDRKDQDLMRNLENLLKHGLWNVNITICNC